MLLKFGCSCLTSDILLFAIMIEFPTTYALLLHQNNYYTKSNGY